MKTILKYALTVLVPGVVQVVTQPYLGSAGSITVAGIVATVGARLLHVTPAPGKAE